MSKQTGFTLIEILISIAIIGILSVVIFASINMFRNRQIIKNATIEVTQAIEEAKVKTITSYNDEIYGVHFGESDISIFTGETYDAEDPDTIVLFADDSISFNLSLSDDGENIVFKRLTGETDDTGSILIELVSNSDYNQTINIDETGGVSF